MNSFSHHLKSYLNILILILIFLIGAMITYLNLSYSFNLSISSKNKKAIFAEESLNRFPEGLKLISIKDLNQFTENDFSKIENWLDQNGKSKSLARLNSKGTLIIEINYSNNFDLATYLNKLFLIPNQEIKYLKINNGENTIQLEMSNI